MLASAGFAATANEAKAQTRTVDWDHLNTYCPVGTTLPAQHTSYYYRVYAAGAGQVGGVCIITTSPYRGCIGVNEANAHLALNQLFDADGDSWAGSYWSARGVDFCDNVLSLCPEGQVDIDGNYFTEGDCEEAPAAPITVNYAADPADGGTVASDIPSGGESAAGATVTLTATPAAGRYVSGWSDAECSAFGALPDIPQECELARNFNFTITAFFAVAPVAQCGANQILVGAIDNGADHRRCIPVSGVVPHRDSDGGPNICRAFGSDAGATRCGEVNGVSADGGLCLLFNGACLSPFQSARDCHLENKPLATIGGACGAECGAGMVSRGAECIAGSRSLLSTVSIAISDSGNGTVTAEWRGATIKNGDLIGESEATVTFRAVASSGRAHSAWLGDCASFAAGEECVLSGLEFNAGAEFAEASADFCGGRTPPEFYDGSGCVDFVSCASPATLNTGTNQCDCPDSAVWNAGTNQCECADAAVFNGGTNQCECNSPNLGTGANCKAPSADVCGNLTPAAFFDGTECVDFAVCVGAAVLNSGTNQCECNSPNEGTGSDCKAPSTEVCGALTPAEFFDGAECVDFAVCSAPTVLNSGTNQCECPGVLELEAETNQCMCNPPNFGTEANCQAPSARFCAEMNPAMFFDGRECVGVPHPCPAGQTAILGTTICTANSNAEFGDWCHAIKGGAFRLNNHQRCALPDRSNCAPYERIGVANNNNICENNGASGCGAGESYDPVRHACEACVYPSVENADGSGCECLSPNFGTGSDCKAPSAEVCGGLSPAKFFDDVECVTLAECAGAAEVNTGTNQCECNAPNEGTVSDCKAPSAEVCGGLSPAKFFDGAACVEIAVCAAPAVLNSGTNQCECAAPNEGTGSDCKEPSAEVCGGLSSAKFFDGTGCVAIPVCAGAAVLNGAANVCECNSPNEGTAADCKAASGEVCKGLTPAKYFDGTGCVDFAVCAGAAVLNGAANVCECNAPNVGAGSACAAPSAEVCGGLSPARFFDGTGCVEIPACAGEFVLDAEANACVCGNGGVEQEGACACPEVTHDVLPGGNCVVRAGDFAGVSDRVLCGVFGGETKEEGGGAVCSGLDESGTFCILGSADVFPCRGLFKRARFCNVGHNRVLVNPFTCGAVCASGGARGRGCE